MDSVFGFGIANGLTILVRGDEVFIGFLTPCKQKLLDELLLTEWDGDGLVDGCGGSGNVSSCCGPSSQKASTRAKL